MDEEVRKSARNRRLKFLNCLYGLSELDPEIPVTRKVWNWNISIFILIIVSTYLFCVKVYPLKEIYFNSASHLDQYQIAYAEKLMEYNKDVLNGKTRADLLSKFLSVISPQDQVFITLTNNWLFLAVNTVYFAESKRIMENNFHNEPITTCRQDFCPGSSNKSHNYWQTNSSSSNLSGKSVSSTKVIQYSLKPCYITPSLTDIKYSWNQSCPVTCWKQAEEENLELIRWFVAS